MSRSTVCDQDKRSWSVHIWKIYSMYTGNTLPKTSCCSMLLSHEMKWPQHQWFKNPDLFLAKHEQDFKVMKSVFWIIPPNSRILECFIQKRMCQCISTVAVIYHRMYVYMLVLEQTVRCSRTVRVLVMFGRFKVRFWA